MQVGRNFPALAIGLAAHLVGAAKFTVIGGEAAIERLEYAAP